MGPLSSWINAYLLAVFFNRVKLANLATVNAGGTLTMCLEPTGLLGRGLMDTPLLLKTRHRLGRETLLLILPCNLLNIAVL